MEQTKYVVVNFFNYIYRDPETFGEGTNTTFGDKKDKICSSKCFFNYIYKDPETFGDGINMTLGDKKDKICSTKFFKIFNYIYRDPETFGDGTNFGDKLRTQVLRI